MTIDWVKAPEGAMYHYGMTWYKEHAGVWFYWSDTLRDWLTTPYASPENFAWWDTAVKRPVAWSGEGRPPVGTVCGLRFKGVDQGEVTVLFISQEVGVFENHTFGHEQCGDLVHYEFYQSCTEVTP